MTREKAMKILSQAFNNIFGEISYEIDTRRTELTQEILLSHHNIGEIKDLVEKLNAMDTAFRDVDHCKDIVNEKIENEDRWYDYTLLSELNRAFRWLPEKDEAK